MKLITSCFLLLISLSNLYAHDFWLEAQPFYAKPGDNVDITIHVGEDMIGDTLPNIPENYSDFSYTSKDGREAILGELARYPAGYFNPEKPGYYTIGYRSTENVVSLNGEKFTHYLKTEGLDKIIDFRKEHNQSDQKAKEIYSRCVKTLVKIGETVELDYSQQRFNYTYEITPLNNPYQLKIGDELTVQATYLGKPLANSLIIAFSKEAAWDKQKKRTDANGIAKVKLTSKGLWLIKSVEMIPSKRPGIDWESFWASLTFQMR